MRKVGLILFSGLVSFTAYLGAWQTKRYFWKVEVMAEREAKLARDPVSLNSVEAFVEGRMLVAEDAAQEGSASTGAGTGDDDPEFTPVVVRGKLLNEHSVLMGPRSAPKHSAPFEDKMGEQSGFHIITPLRVTTVHSGRDGDGAAAPSTEEIVLVNRGWVSKSKHAEVFRQLVEGEDGSPSSSSSLSTDNGQHGGGAGGTEVTAVLRKSEGTPSGFIPAPDLLRRHFFSVDAPAIVDFVRTRMVSCCLFCLFVCWLVCWLGGWLDGWLVGWCNGRWC